MQWLHLFGLSSVSSFVDLTASVGFLRSKLLDINLRCCSCHNPKLKFLTDDIWLIQFAKEGREECRWAKWWWNQRFWVTIILSALQKISQSKNIFLPSSIPNRLPRLLVFTPFFAWITPVLMRICWNSTSAHLMCILYSICLALFLLGSFNVGVKLETWAQNEVHTSSTAIVLWPFLWSWQLLGFLSDIAWYLYVFVDITPYQAVLQETATQTVQCCTRHTDIYIEILELQNVCASARVCPAWPVVSWDASAIRWFLRSMHCLHRTGLVWVGGF